MADTKVICPDWLTSSEVDKLNLKGLRTYDLKQNAPRYLTSGRCYLLRLLPLFIGAGALMGFMIMTSYNSNDNYDESPLKSKNWKRHVGIQNNDECTTPECLQVATSIRKSMNMSVDPCEDFFQYSCGGWIQEKTPLVQPNVFYSNFHHAMPHEVNLILRNLLNRKLPIPQEFMETKAYQNLFTFHNSCMTAPQKPENDRLTEALEFLKKLQQFQVGSTAFDPDQWNLTKALIELIRVSGTPLLNIGIRPDIRVPGQWAVAIMPPQPGIRTPGLHQNSGLKSRWSLFSDISDDPLTNDIVPIMDPSEMEGDNDIHSRIVDELKVYKRYLNKIPKKPLRKKSYEQNVPSTTTTEHSATITGTQRSTSKPVFDTTSRTSITGPLTTMNYDATTYDPAKHNPAASRSPSSSPSQPSTTVGSLPTDELTDIPDDEVHESKPKKKKTKKTFSAKTVSKEGDESQHQNTKKVHSVKAIFKEAQKFMARQRKESISTIVQKLFSKNGAEGENRTVTPENSQPSDIHSAIIKDFVPKLDKIQPAVHEVLQEEQRHITLDQLQELAPAIEWRYLLLELFGMNVTNDVNIYIFHPNYFSDLNHLLVTMDPWKVHYGMISLFIYDVMLQAVVPTPSVRRDLLCLQLTKTVFGDVMSHMYLHHLGNETLNSIHQYADNMLDYLLDEVWSSVTWAEWLSSEDRKEAFEKLDGLHREVVSLDKQLDLNYINGSHEVLVDLNSKDSFFINLIEVLRAYRTSVYDDMYHKPINKEKLTWSIILRSFTVNAFYVVSTNTIAIPQAFFQQPFFSTKAPASVNYGYAGTYMAHEIIHALDYQGTRYDHWGARSQPFSNDSRLHLLETAECYDKLLTDKFYEVVNLKGASIAIKTDNTTTVNENLADIGGIRHAFRAYQQWQLHHDAEPRLPDLELNPHQLFFVSAIQPFCSVMPVAAKIYLLSVDKHLPNDIRMNAMLMNTPEFAEVFNCKTESRMVAKETCPIFPPISQ